MTYTYAVMRISRSAYEEIAGKLREAGHEQAFHKDDGEHGTVIDMHGIALAIDPEIIREREPTDDLG